MLLLFGVSIFSYSMSANVELAPAMALITTEVTENGKALSTLQGWTFNLHKVPECFFKSLTVANYNCHQQGDS